MFAREHCATGDACLALVSSTLIPYEKRSSIRELAILSLLIALRGTIYATPSTITITKGITTFPTL